MSDDWYAKIDGQEFGPMPLDELIGRLRGEQLSLADSVREGAGGQWVPAVSVAALRDAIGLGAADSDANGPIIGKDPLSGFDFVDNLDVQTSGSVPEQMLSQTAAADATGSAMAPAARQPEVHEQTPNADEGEAAPSVAETSLQSRHTVVERGTDGAGLPQEHVKQRPQFLIRISRGQKLIVVGLLAAIALVGYWTLGEVRKAAYRTAYDDLEQLYQRLEEAQKADYDAEQWNDFVADFHTQRRQILARVQAAPKGSAANYIAGAANLLETLAELARREHDSPDGAKISRSAVESRFLAHMKLARQQLPGGKAP